MENNKKLKNFIKTTIREFLNENDNYIPKQQPYGGFVSHPKTPTKLERSVPFMSTNIVGRGDNESYTIRYYDIFTDDMICKLVNILTNETSCNIIDKSSMIKLIEINDVMVGTVEYGNQVSIHTKYIKNFKTLMKDIFPNEYREYIGKYN